MWVLLFLVLPIVEIWLLVEIGHQIGVWPTLALLLGTAILGAQLARAEGLRVLRQLQLALAERRAPEGALISTFLVFAGGVLLVVPGVLTDAAGVLLLFPPTRALVARLLRRRWERALGAGRVVVDLGGFGAGPARYGRTDLDDIIDVEAEPVAPALAPAAKQLESPAAAADRDADRTKKDTP